MNAIQLSLWGTTECSTCRKPVSVPINNTFLKDSCLVYCSKKCIKNVPPYYYHIGYNVYIKFVQLYCEQTKGKGCSHYVNYVPMAVYHIVSHSDMYFTCNNCAEHRIEISPSVTIGCEIPTFIKNKTKELLEIICNLRKDIKYLDSMGLTLEYIPLDK